MKEDSINSSASTVKKEGSEIGGLFGRSRYKFWALAALLLLAFWSMFTGSVTLKWSSGYLFPFSDDTNLPIADDLDILEVEEREKTVRHMWDVYAHSSNIRLPQFWQEAFQAGYENLVSDLPGVRDAALSEIAKMSMFSLNLDPVPRHLDSNKNTRKRTKVVTSAKASMRKARR